MKGWLCALLAMALCLSAAGCVQAPVEGPAPTKTAESAPEKTDDALLLAMEEALTGARPGDVRVDPPDRNQRVRMSEKLVRDMAGLLTNSPFERVEMRSIEGDGELGYQQISLAGGETCSLEIFLCGGDHALYPGKTVLWLQVGEESGQYLFDGEVYDNLLRLTGKNMLPDTVTLEGEYLSLEPNVTDDDGSPLPPDGMLQFGGTLLLYYNIYAEKGNRAVFTTVDASTGETLGEATVENGIRTVEKTGYHGWDYRVLWEDGSFSYRSASDPAQFENVRLPAQLREHAAAWSHYAVCDIDPESGLAAAADGEGVWLAGPDGAARLVLPSDGIRGLLGERWPDGLPGDFGTPRYVEPRLHGGKLLTAVVAVPGAQSDDAALVVCDLAAGKVTGSYDGFGAMRSGTAYPDDMTVVMMADRGDTVLDLAAGGTRENPVPNDWGVRETYTADYKTYLTAQTGRADDGQALVELAADGEEKPFFTARGGSFGVLAVTEDYALAGYRDADTDGLALLEWNRAGAMALRSSLPGETEGAGAEPYDVCRVGDVLIVLARSAEGGFFVEPFDGATGASLGGAARLDQDARPIALAPVYDRQGFDYRLLTSEAILYGRVGQPFPAETYTLPDRLMSALLPDGGSFDLWGETVAYAAKDGVWVAKADGSDAKLLLPSREIGERADGIPALYADPRLMGGGRYLVGMQAILGGETFYCGLTVLNLEPGEKTKFFDPDKSYPGGVLYPNDYTVGLRQGDTADYFSLPGLQRTAGPNEPYPFEAYRFA